MVQFLIARHCSATGQEREAELTSVGIRQAQVLSMFLEHYPIDVHRIITSPFKRAVDSIHPFAEAAGIKLEEEERLAERMLSDKPLEEWLEILERSFTEMDLKVYNGESSNEAMERSSSVMKELMKSEDDDKTVLLMTHGNLMTLMLRYFDDTFGYEDWKNLRNPDLYLVKHTDTGWDVERVYHDK